MGIRDRFGKLFSRDRKGQPDRPSIWNRVTNWVRRRGREEPEQPPAVPAGGDGIDLGGTIFYAPTGEIGSVRIIINGTFGSKSGGNIYAEWNGTVDTDRGNRRPTADNARRLAAALTAQDPNAVVEAINIILTLDYAGQVPGGQGGFSSYGPTEGIRVIGIGAISITWT